ncbi:MAG: zinc-binding dehydrogenase [Proteobacteria bacterium]|nr:zinc-binding dehydrogenase [Pseudomonadota bacterium]
MTSSSHSLPASMLAIDIRQPGEPEELVAANHPLPAIGARELLVRVVAAGVNRPDVFQRRGAYPPPPGASPIPGLEFSGEVVAVGERVARYRVGDLVCALVAGGAYAEYCAVDERNALPVPAGLTLLEAAALPETFFTVWANVFQRGRLKAGETVLIHGGTSGIGTVATMLAKAFGATVLVTVGSAEKCRAALELGADAAINYREQDFVAETKRLTGGRGAEVIVDLIAGDYVARNYAAAAVDGRIVQIGIQNGVAHEVNFGLMLVKRLTHMGSTLRSRSIEDKATIARELEQSVWPLLAAGQVRPRIFKTFALEEAAQAHALMESSAHIGKIMLTTAAPGAL